MSRLRRCIPVRSIRRVSRFAATLSVLPAFVLSPLAAQAILIHDHHGHDTHGHAVSVHELDKLQNNPEHQHEDHEHDGPAVESAGSEGLSLVIMLQVSEGLARGRALPSSGTAVAGRPLAPSTNVVTIVTQQSNRFCTERPSRFAHSVRARSLLEGILLTSHALLL